VRTGVGGAAVGNSTFGSPDGSWDLGKALQAARIRYTHRSGLFGVTERYPNSSDPHLPGSWTRNPQRDVPELLPRGRGTRCTDANPQQAISIEGKDAEEKRSLLQKCAETTLNSKLVGGEKAFFAKCALPLSPFPLLLTLPAPGSFSPVPCRRPACR
jgi:hypothetical protein